MERSTRIEPAGAVVAHSSATWRTASGDGSDSMVISPRSDGRDRRGRLGAFDGCHTRSIDVVHRDLVTVVDEVVRDVPADVAEPDHSDAHCCPPGCPGDGGESTVAVTGVPGAAPTEDRAMSLRDHVICDSDLHVMEPPDLWERYIEPAYAHAAPRGLSEIPRDMRVKVKNHVMLRLGAVRPAAPVGPRGGGWRPEHDNVYAASEARGWDAQSQIDAMDAEGLSMAVLFPSRGLFVLGLDSVEKVGH